VSMANATYPVSGFQSQEPSTAVGGWCRPSSCRGLPPRLPLITTSSPGAWGFWASLGWFGVAVAASFVVVFVVVFVWRIANPNVALNPRSPILIYFAANALSVAAVLVLILAARRAGWKARDYLGFVVPKPRDVLIGLGWLVAFAALVIALAYVVPSLKQTAVTSEYRAAMGSLTGIVLFWLTVVVTAPVAEEIIFRGFLFRGWSESRMGAVGALTLTSLIFASAHTQYNLLGMAEIFGLGLLLGLARWRSGSTALAILMHAAWNLAGVATVALSV
jgi:membrane protease YdiL (CAAX protease family)